MNRRNFLGMVTGAWLARISEASVPPGATLIRRYRADAQVLVLSLPILRRSGVGGGSIVWREWTEADGSCRLLEFTGYSLPEKAAGLNRLGFIREKSIRQESLVREASYFGVMTASPEESVEEAHKALNSNAAESAYTAIHGRVAGVDVETASAHFRGPARLSPEHRDDLLARAERALAAVPNRPPEFPVVAPVPAPFLHALAEVLKRPGHLESEYLYSGRLYRLSVSRSSDEKAAAYFRGKGILRGDARVARITGKVRRKSGGKETNFRLWVEEQAAQPVPLRIDFQPRSYLRLIMEAEA